MKNDLSRIEDGDRLCVSVSKAAKMLDISRNNAYERIKKRKYLT
ncbi:hypothetical protein ACFLYS_02620 [Chloroflexota bacterium]